MAMGTVATLGERAPVKYLVQTCMTCLRERFCHSDRVLCNTFAAGTGGRSDQLLNACVHAVAGIQVWGFIRDVIGCGQGLRFCT